MDRQTLEKMNKPDLLALAQGKQLAVTPAMTKSDLVEILLANAAVEGANSADDETPPAAPPTADAALQAHIAQLEAQLAAKAAPAMPTPSTPKVDPLAINDPDADKKQPMPKEGALRTLDGELVEFKRVFVTIMATDSEKEDVKLGLNGHQLQIKRNVKVAIPEHYLNVLADSVVHTVTKDPETGKVEQVQIPRYPYIVHGPA